MIARTGVILKIKLINNIKRHSLCEHGLCWENRVEFIKLTKQLCMSYACLKYDENKITNKENKCLLRHGQNLWADYICTKRIQIRQNDRNHNIIN